MIKLLKKFWRSLPGVYSHHIIVRCPYKWESSYLDDYEGWRPDFPGFVQAKILDELGIKVQVTIIYPYESKFIVGFDNEGDLILYQMKYL